VTRPDRQGIYDYPFLKLDTEESTYVTGGVIPYPGSDEEGIPTKISVVCGKKGESTTFSVRIYDKTNALVIAKKTNKSDDYPSILDLGTVSNVPEGPAIWEIQVKKTAGVAGKVVTAASVVMEF
jgi:hypothetical protein